MSTLWGLLMAVLIVFSLSTFVIWIVSKLRLGLELNGFGAALLLALIIALLAGVLTVIVSFAGWMDGSGFVGGIVHWVVSLLVLMLAARFMPVVKVTNFVGVLVASLGVGAVYWLGGLLLGAVIT